MNTPCQIETSSFQLAWIRAVRHLQETRWACHNLVVHIRDISILDYSLHGKVSAFAEDNGLIGPKHVAYTIFPHKLYKERGGAARVFERYNSTSGVYSWTRKRRHSGWGTYFRRMTHFGDETVPVNQLANIINKINTRDRDYTAAYTISIQKPGNETVRTMGGPCLNYIAVQIEPGEPRRLGLLAVYRNHDFLERAYGNYWGLCNLLAFIAGETGSTAGPLTCVSSHAYIPTKRTSLGQLIDEIS